MTPTPLNNNHHMGVKPPLLSSSPYQSDPVTCGCNEAGSGCPAARHAAAVWRRLVTGLHRASTGPRYSGVFFSG